eukprot:PhF_6_TR3668/c0_g1_i1/m.5172
MYPNQHGGGGGGYFAQQGQQYFPPQFPSHHHHHYHQHQHQYVGHHHHHHHHYQSQQQLYGQQQQTPYHHHHHHHGAMMMQQQQPYRRHHHHHHQHHAPPPLIPDGPVTQPVVPTQGSTPAPTAPTPAPLAPPKQLPKITYVTTTTEFVEACANLSGCKTISIEAFKDKNSGEETYLALAQEDENCIYVVDVRSVKKNECARLLLPIVQDPDVTVLVYDTKNVQSLLTFGLQFKRLVDLQSCQLLGDWQVNGINTVKSYSVAVEKTLRMVPRLPMLEPVHAQAISAEDNELWLQQPLADIRRQYAASCVMHHMALYRAYRRIIPKDFDRLVEQVKNLLLVALWKGVSDQLAGGDLSTIAPAGHCPKCRKRGHAREDCPEAEAPPPPPPPPPPPIPLAPPVAQQHLYPQPQPAYPLHQHHQHHQHHIHHHHHHHQLLACEFCGKVGHTIDNCYSRNPEMAKNLVCTHCGHPGHTENRCFDKYPHLRQPPQCTHCMRFGHTVSQCHELGGGRKRMASQDPMAMGMGMGAPMMYMGGSEFVHNDPMAKRPAF